MLGQIARELDPAAIEGRLIILPTINPPALLAGQRVVGHRRQEHEPCLAGRSRTGTITERIVSWLDTELLSHTDVLMDLHTGGNAMDLVPMSMCHYSEDPAFRDRIRAAQVAYNAPLSVELRLPPTRPTASGRAHDRGILVVGSESGGGHPARPESLASATTACATRSPSSTCCRHACAGERVRPATRFTRKWGHQAEMAAERAGMFVPYRTGSGTRSSRVSRPAGSCPSTTPFADAGNAALSRLRPDRRATGEQRRRARRRPLLDRRRHRLPTGPRRTIDGSAIGGIG